MAPAVAPSISPAATPRPAGAFTIDDEAAGDVPAREALLHRVFGRARFRKTSARFREGRLPAEGLSLVARGEDGRLLGTVRLWHAAVGATPVLLLGPLAVVPEHAGAGIGSALMRAAIARAAARGHGAILLVGDEPYYRRFGFSAAHTARLALPGPVERERFLALELVPDALAGAEGLVRPTGARLAPAARARKAA